MNTTTRMVFIKKRVLKSRLILIFILLLNIFSSCDRRINNCSFRLQEFVISNYGLDSIVNLFTHDYNSVNNNMDNGNVIVIDFQYHDSIPQVWISIHEKNELRDKYIFQQNKRIIGYLIKNERTIVLLSGVNLKSDFEFIFGSFIYPKSNTKRFDYIFYPDNQYESDSVVVRLESGDVIKKSRWPVVYSMYNPHYVQFKYVDGVFVDANRE